MRILLILLCVLAALAPIISIALGWKLWRSVKSASSSACTLALLSVFLALPILNGCAFGKCELGKLPATIASVVVDVVAIAAQPSGYVRDLTNLASRLAPGQVDCAAQAILDAAPGTPPGAELAGTAVPRSTVVAHLREYVAQRKASGAIYLACAR